MYLIAMYANTIYGSDAGFFSRFANVAKYEAYQQSVVQF